MLKPSSIFCFGLGYTARALARVLQARGWSIAGTCRSREKCDRLIAEGFRACLFDGKHPSAEITGLLKECSYVLISIKPQPSGDPVLKHHREDFAVEGSLRWVGYLSTTVVYGNHDGDWVNENSELKPGSERGKLRVKAERAWLGLWRDAHLPLHVFRLAGIYGPGRGALEKVKLGTAHRIGKPGQVFSHIHVDDAVRVLLASMENPRAGSIYNVCDDEPGPPAAMVEYACRLLSRPTPPLIPLDRAGLTDLGRSFYQENKRVCNRKIKEELGVQLRYPDYRAGLRAILGQAKT